MRWPVSSLSRPSPTASTLPFCGFSFAVSGRTSPEAVVVSSSTALTIRRSPSGLSFMGRSLRWDARRGHWHSPNESAKRYPLYRGGTRLHESSTIGSVVRAGVAGPRAWGAAVPVEAHDGGVVFEPASCRFKDGVEEMLHSLTRMRLGARRLERLKVDVG